MQAKGTVVLFVISMVLLAFAIGTLTSRNAGAQFAGAAGIFPRQSDLWSFSADGGITAYDDGLGNKGHLMVIRPDNNGRLPVLTTFHSGNKALHRFVGDTMQPIWVQSDQYVPSILYRVQGHLDALHGVVLYPGKYLIQRTDGGGFPESTELLLSGYWARP